MRRRGYRRASLATNLKPHQTVSQKFVEDPTRVGQNISSRYKMFAAIALLKRFIQSLTKRNNEIQIRVVSFEETFFPQVTPR